MDTDGHVGTRRNLCEFTTTSPALRDGVSELLASLGYKFSCREGVATIDGREIGPKYRIQFTAREGRNPCLMKRKLDRIKWKPTTWRRRSRTVQIVSVTPCEPRPMRCITVDSPSGLFRFGETMLYTHNTPLASGLLIYAQYIKGNPGAQSFFCAADLTQANIAFSDTSKMVKANPRLDGISQVMRGYKVIEIKGGEGGIIRALTSDGDTKHGLRPFCFVADELHKHKRPGAGEPLVTVLHKKTAGQKEPLEIYITTADFQRESICNDMHDAALQVIEDPALNPHMLPVIWAADKEDDWRDPETWKKCNPSFGVTKSEEYFRQEVRDIGITPTKLNDFLRLDLNIRTGQDVAWLDMDGWNNCPQIEDGDKDGPCYAGLDLGSTDDLTALALFWPQSLACEVHFFAPESKLGGKYQVQYLHYHKNGHITMTPGVVTDYDFVREHLRELMDKYNIEAIGYDPWNFQTDGARWLDQEGWPMEEFRQGTGSMNEPCKHLEKLVKGARLKHGYHPVLKWCANNAEVRPDSNGNIRVVKMKSHQKVDGVVALAVAVGMAMLNGYGEDEEAMEIVAL